MKHRIASRKVLMAALLLGLGGGTMAIAEAHPGKGGDHESDSPQRQMMHQMMRQMHGCMQQRMEDMSGHKTDGGQMDRMAMRAQMMEMMKGCMAEMEKMPHAGGAMDGHGGAGHKGDHDGSGAGHKADGHKH